MKDHEILFKLPKEELGVSFLKKALEARHVPFQADASKEDLSELLQRKLEKSQPPEILIQLRLKEIEAVAHSSGKDVLIAKLKSRNELWSGNKGVLIDRLCYVLEKEKLDFEEQIGATEELFMSQRKPNSPEVEVVEHPKMDPEGTKIPSQEKYAASGDGKPPLLTQEDRIKIDQKRKRALELQAESKKAKKQVQVSSPPAKATGIATESFTREAETLRTPQNSAPRAAAVVTDERVLQAATFVLEAAHMVGSPNKPLSLSDDMAKEYGGIQDKTNKYEEEVEEKEKKIDDKAKEDVKAKYKDEEKWKKAGELKKLDNPYLHPTEPCIKCGDYSHAKGLCIVWQHTGKMQQEQDQFRWDCCGRLDPQPCFVGLHCRKPLQEQNRKILKCSCGKPAHLKRTKKNGANAGRYFFRCNSTGGGRCKFFRWADDFFDLPKQVPLVASDGCREWEYPWANPHSEPDLMKSEDLDLKRKRLAAALLLKEMCSLVDGSTGVICNTAYISDLIGKVMEILPYPTQILEKLLPLRPDQVARRFDSLGSVHNVTKVECEKILVDFIKTSPFAKYVGIRVKQNMPNRCVDLSGLRNYLHV